MIEKRGAPGPRRTVFVLFKDAAQAGSLARDLSHLGFSAVAIAGEAEAFEKVKVMRPSCAIIEDRFSGKSPPTLVDELRRASGAKMSAILVSSIRPKAAVLEQLSRDLGDGEVLVKPITVEDLAKRLHNLSVEKMDPPSAWESVSVTNYNSPQEVFYSLLGKAIRSGGPTELCRERPEGSIHLYLRGHVLLAATSRDPKDGDLGSILIRDGHATREAVHEARRHLESGRDDQRLGEILVSRGVVSKKVVTECLARQAEQRVTSMFGWRTGTAWSQPGTLPPAGAALVHLNALPLLFHGLQTGGDPVVLARQLESSSGHRFDFEGVELSTVKKLAKGADAQFLDLLAGDQTVARAIHRSGISKESASVWITFLTYFLGAKHKDRPTAKGAQETGSFSLKLKKPALAPNREKEEQKRAAADREYSLGWKLLTSGMFAEAKQRFEASLALDPHRAASEINLGWCNFKLLANPRGPELVTATDLILRGIAREPSLGFGYVYLGRIHAALGEDEQAGAAYCKALEVDPGNGEALAELRQLNRERAKKSLPPAPRSVEPTAISRAISVPPKAAAQSMTPHGTSTSSLITPRYVPPLNPALARFGLVLVAWGDERGPAPMPLPAPAKIRLVQEIRMAGASLEEFSLTRVSCVIRPGAPGDDYRFRAAWLGVRLLDVLKELAGTMPPSFAARAAVLQGAGPESDPAASVSEAIAGGGALLDIAGGWQVVGSAAMYQGFEGLVEGKRSEKSPDVLEIVATAEGLAALTTLSHSVASSSTQRPAVETQKPILEASPAPPSTASWAPPMPPPMVIQGIPASPPPRTSMPISATQTFGPKHMLSPGDVVGTYRIERLIGVGGMGEVYQATDVGLSRAVAVKVMRREVLANPLSLRRFQREAQGLARINCPYVTQIYGLSLDSNPALLVMEYVDGPSLRDLVADRGPLEIADAVDVGLQIVRGLQAVYEKGLIHRDVNPKNVLIDPTGTVKITDFGMVKMELAAASPSKSTNIVGTPLYMSPEQALGADVDFRTDLYALGLTLFHLIAGRPPFSGSSVGEILTKQIHEPLPSLRAFVPNAPEALCELVAKLAAKKPEERPQTHAAVASALSAIRQQVAGGSVSMSVPPPASATASIARSRAI